MVISEPAEPDLLSLLESPIADHPQSLMCHSRATPVTADVSQGVLLVFLMLVFLIQILLLWSIQRTRGKLIICHESGNDGTSSKLPAIHDTLSCHCALYILKV